MALTPPEIARLRKEHPEYAGLTDAQVEQEEQLSQALANREAPVFDKEASNLQKLHDYFAGARESGLITRQQESALKTEWSGRSPEAVKQAYEQVTKEGPGLLNSWDRPTLRGMLQTVAPEAKPPSAAQRVADFAGTLADRYALTFQEQSVVRGYLDKAIVGYQGDAAQERLNEVLAHQDVGDVLQQALQQTATQAFREGWGELVGNLTAFRDAAQPGYEKSRWQVLLDNLGLAKPAQESAFNRWFGEQIQAAASGSFVPPGEWVRPSDMVLAVKMAGASNWLNSRATTLVNDAASGDAGGTPVRIMAQNVVEQTFGGLLMQAQTNVRNAALVYDLVAQQAGQLRSAADSGRYMGDHAKVLRDMSDALRKQANTLAEGYVTGGGAAAGLTPEDYVSQQTTGILAGAAGSLSGSLVPGDIFGSVQGVVSAETPEEKAQSEGAREQEVKMGRLRSIVDDRSGRYSPEQQARAKAELEGQAYTGSAALSPTGTTVGEPPLGGVPQEAVSDYLDFISNLSTGFAPGTIVPGKGGVPTLEQFLEDVRTARTREQRATEESQRENLRRQNLNPDRYEQSIASSLLNPTDPEETRRYNILSQYYSKFNLPGLPPQGTPRVPVAQRVGAAMPGLPFPTVDVGGQQMEVKRDAQGNVLPIKTGSEALGLTPQQGFEEAVRKAAEKAKQADEEIRRTRKTRTTAIKTGNTWNIETEEAA